MVSPCSNRFRLVWQYQSLTNSRLCRSRTGADFSLPCAFPSLYSLGREDKVRLKYTAKRSLSLDDISLGPNEDVVEIMEAVWEGATYSNWIEVEVGDNG